MIECVPDAKSRDQIGRKINTDLFVYFKKEYGEESSQGRMEETTDRIATLQTSEPYQISDLIHALCQSMSHTGWGICTGNFVTSYGAKVSKIYRGGQGHSALTPFISPCPGNERE